MKILWTPNSESDLDLIHGVIKEKFDHNKANEILLDLIERTESLLSKNPLAGKVLESNPLFSVIVIEGNQIFYAENPKDKNLYIIYVQARKSELDRNRLK